MLRARGHGPSYVSDERIMPYLDAAIFGSTTLVHVFEFRIDLISGLVERWYLETHTFHFLCGKCTITLEDVAMQLGLPMDGDAVIGSSHITDLAVLCYDLFGCSPDDGTTKYTSLKLSWLKANFETLSNYATEKEKMSAAWAYIL